VVCVMKLKPLSEIARPVGEETSLTLEVAGLLWASGPAIF
jgi:hypothetical protein